MSSCFQIQWPFPYLYHPSWKTILSYLPYLCILLFSLLFQWLHFLCWLSAWVLNVGMPQTTAPALCLILFIPSSRSPITKRKPTQSLIITPTKWLSLKILSTILYYLVYAHMYTHAHIHAYFYPCFNVISLSLLEHKPRENRYLQALAHLCIPAKRAAACVQEVLN